MKKRILALLLSIMIMVPMFTAGPSFAAGEADSGTVINSVYDTGSTGSTASDNTAVEITQSPADLDNSAPADIVPGQLGQEDLPAPQSGSIEKLEELARQADQEMAGSGAAEKLHSFIAKLKGTRVWDTAHLVAVSSRIRVFTINHLDYINTHPRAKLAIVLMTDETVRLAHNNQMNEKTRLVVYNNAVHTYAMLGCYKRAAAVMERALNITPNRSAGYDNLKQLYKRIGNKGLKVFVKGQRPNFDVKPMVQNGRTMVPIRAISEAMGAKVNYDPKQQKVMINNGSIDMNLFINNKGAIVNGKKITLDEPARVVNGRTMVPLRFVSENMGANVKWDADTETVTVE